MNCLTAKTPSYEAKQTELKDFSEFDFDNSLNFTSDFLGVLCGLAVFSK
jgi:hypothetical protein